MDELIRKIFIVMVIIYDLTSRFFSLPLPCDAGAFVICGKSPPNLRQITPLFASNYELICRKLQKQGSNSI